MEPTELNNQEAQYGQPEQAAEETQPVAPAEDVANPADLADAFAALRAKDQTSAGVPMETTEATGEQQQYQQQPVDNRGNGEYGDTADYVPGTDWAAKDRETVAGIRTAVLASVGQDWQQKGRRALKIDDLVRRDERSGELYYINLNDDPQKWNQPGYRGTDKATARQALKDFNDDMQAQWNEDCKIREKELMNYFAPHRRLLAFGPTYDKLDSETKSVLDSLAEDYVITLDDGTPFGFNADLNVLLKQAQRIVANNRARYGTKQQETQQQPQVRQPAVDSRSSAGGSRQAKPNDPKNIDDAIAMFEQMQKEQRKAGN